MVLKIGPKGTSSLWIFGGPYSLRGLEPCVHNCWMTSSECDKFLRRKVVCCSTDSVGSLGNFLYKGAPKRATIFWLQLVLRTTVTCPLAAGRTMRSALFHRVQRILSGPDRLSLGLLEAFRILSLLSDLLSCFFWQRIYSFLHTADNVLNGQHH